MGVVGDTPIPIEGGGGSVMASYVEVVPSPKSPAAGRGSVSHHSLTYLPDEGVLVVTDSKGTVHFYDSTLEALLGTLGMI